MTGSIIGLFSDDPLTFSLLFKRSEACWEQTGTEEECYSGEKCQRRTLWQWIYSLQPGQHRTDLGNVLNGLDLYRVGLCLAGVAAGMRPRAQQHTVSVRVKEGALHPSVKMTQCAVQGAKATIVLQSLVSKLRRINRQLILKVECFYFKTTLAVFILNLRHHLPESDICRDLHAQYVTWSRYKN